MDAEFHDVVSGERMWRSINRSHTVVENASVGIGQIAKMSSMGFTVSQTLSLPGFVGNINCEGTAQAYYSYASCTCRRGYGADCIVEV